MEEKIKNSFEAIEELKGKYEEILKDLVKRDGYDWKELENFLAYDGSDIDDFSAEDFLTMITNFNTPNCSLCKAVGRVAPESEEYSGKKIYKVESDCSKIGCVIGLSHPDIWNAPCVYEDSYNMLAKAIGVNELIDGLKARINRFDRLLNGKNANSGGE